MLCSPAPTPPRRRCGWSAPTTIRGFLDAPSCAGAPSQSRRRARARSCGMICVRKMTPACPLLILPLPACASRRRPSCLPSDPRWRTASGTSAARNARLPPATLSKARLTASLPAITDGSDILAIVSATFIASSIRLAAGTTRATRPGALGLGRVHHAAGQDHVHRLGLADRARQPLRAADAGDDAELDLGLAELGVVGGDDDVAQHGELAAAAERKARHRRDDRLAGARGAIPVGAEIARDRPR